MKKIFLVSSLLLCFSIVSCGDDDDSPNRSEQGTWKLVNRIEVGDDQDPTVLDCEKLTTYTFSGKQLTGVAYEANDEETKCLEPIFSDLVYEIRNGKTLVSIGEDGNPIKSDFLIEIEIFENEMKLIFRDPNDTPTSALKRETFERQ